MIDRRLSLITTLMVVASVSWRKGEYYAGGADPVVMAKAGLSGLAMLMAMHWVVEARTRRPVGGRTIVLVGGYLVATLLGAADAGAHFPTAVLVVRVLIIMATVSCLLAVWPGMQVVQALVTSMGGLALVAAVTGLAAPTPDGLLSGGIPPVSRNGLAMLAAAPAILLIWRAMRGAASIAEVALIVVFLGIVWRTGSRTGLAMVLVACIVMILQAQAVSRAFSLVLLAAIPALTYLFLGTSVAETFATRGDATTVTSLSNRTIAWSAALDRPENLWQHWFGGGMSLKEISVDARWWSIQILDSSWISAYVQAGLVGVTVLALLTIIGLGSAMGMPRPDRLLVSGLLVFLVGRSYLESGLIDGTNEFTLFFAVLMSAEHVTRRDPAGGAHPEGIRGDSAPPPPPAPLGPPPAPRLAVGADAPSVPTR